MADILVIDDEEQIRKHFQMLLPHLGYTVSTAANGDEGVAAAADPGIRLIITDLCMPGSFSETALVRELRRLRPGLPIVVISGYPSGEALQACEEIGVLDFLSKPFELSFISSILERALGPGQGGSR
jgi:DNA-binding NtrC family response regulator